MLFFPLVDEPEGNTDGQREVNVVMKTPAVKATRKLYQIITNVHNMYCIYVVSNNKWVCVYI